jgi:diacylglycerol kinase (ATP)
MRLTLIHNPSAGDGRPAGEDLEEILEGAGFQLRYASTDKDWKKALDKRADAVVAAGGDGTVAKVMRRMRGDERPVALLPLGTANNICRTLGVIGDARAIASEWRVAAVRPYDIGLLHAPWGEEVFVEAFGGGIFAESIVRGRQEVEEPGSIVGPETDRAMLLLREVVNAARPRPWRIEVDGRDVSGDYLAVEVLNIRFAGPNVPLAAEADPGDGLLDVVLIGEQERRSLLEHLSGRLEHAAADLPHLRIERGRQVRLALARPFPPLHIDDDIVGDDIGALDVDEATFEIELEAGAIKLLGADAHVARQP